MQQEAKLISALRKENAQLTQQVSDRDAQIKELQSVIVLKDENIRLVHEKCGSLQQKIEDMELEYKEKHSKLDGAMEVYEDFK